MFRWGKVLDDLRAVSARWKVQPSNDLQWAPEYVGAALCKEIAFCSLLVFAGRNWKKMRCVARANRSGDASAFVKECVYFENSSFARAPSASVTLPLQGTWASPYHVNTNLVSCIMNLHLCRPHRMIYLPARWRCRSVLGSFLIT